MKVFLSYSGSDEKWAGLLRHRLADEGIDVWDPSSEIGPGENWGLKYGKGLAAADTMIVLLSPDSAKSDWVRHEIEYALSSPRFRDRLFTVLVKPTAEVPWILQKQPVIRASKNVEETVSRVASVLKKSQTAVGG